MSLAIAYHMKRKGKKMAKGGEAKKELKAKWSEDNDEDGKRGGWTMPGGGRINTSSFVGGKPAPGHGAVHTDMKKLDLATGKYSMHGPKGKLPMAEGGDVCMHCGGYARGGSVEDAHEKQVGVNMPVYTGRYGAGTSGAGLEVRGKRSPNARGMNKETLEDLKRMKGPTKGRSGFAEGGEALADFDSADFDAGGFEGTEADYSGDNSGDHLSDEGEEQRRKSALMGYLRRKTG